MKNTTLTLITLLTAAVSANAATIVGFSAEDATLLGSGWTTGNVDAGAIGGTYVTSPRDTGAPTAPETASYTVTLEAATTYDLYVRFRVDTAGDTLNPALYDSMYVGNAFGTGPTFINVNGLAETQNAYTDADGTEITDDTWQWVNFSTQSTTADVPQYTTTTAGTYTFEVGYREALHMDAYAFVTGGAVTSAELTAAIPEPGTYALLAGCFALASVMIRRRR